MKRSSVHSHELRLDRALQHLQSLESEVGRWLEKRPYRTFTQLDAERGEKFVCVEVLEQPPLKLSLIIGDCLHNLHSALDNLVYELALSHHGGGPLPDEIADSSAFPIYCYEEDFLARKKNGDLSPRSGLHKIRGIAPAAQTIIQELQPYHRGDDCFMDDLWILNELSNVDKHRLPHLAIAVPESEPTIVSMDPGVTDVYFIYGPIKDRAPVVRYRYSGNPDAEVQVDLDGTLSVGFEPGTATLNLLTASRNLRMLRDYIISDVVTPLRSCL